MEKIEQVKKKRGRPKKIDKDVEVASKTTEEDDIDSKIKQVKAEGETLAAKYINNFDKFSSKINNLTTSDLKKLSKSIFGDLINLKLYDNPSEEVKQVLECGKNLMLYRDLIIEASKTLSALETFKKENEND